MKNGLGMVVNGLGTDARMTQGVGFNRLPRTEAGLVRSPLWVVRRIENDKRSRTYCPLDHFVFNSGYNLQNLEIIMATTLMTPKGEITLPAEIREKYGFDDWKVLSVVDVGDGSILLKPYASELTKTAEQMRKTLEEDGITLNELLQTLDEVRKEMFKERYGNIGSQNP
jgi:bifunctional DNA-binding transcriptional regulator/antitoxin component of YhaV-PrlF toxin-antitoxin module